MGEPLEIPGKRSPSLMAVGIALPLMLLLMLATILGVRVYRRRQDQRRGGPEEPLLARDDDDVIRLSCLGNHWCPFQQHSSTHLPRS